MDSRAACSLWTAIWWPSCCITERRKKTDKEKKRERSGGHPSKLTNVYIYILSLFLACADLQFAFSVQRSALLCWSWEQTKQRRWRRFVRSYSSRVHRCIVHSWASKRKRNKEGRIKRKFVHHMFIHLYASNIHIQEHHLMNICQIKQGKKCVYVHTNDDRIWMIGKRIIRTDEKWLLITLLLLLECWLITLIVLKKGENLNTFRRWKIYSWNEIWKRQVGNVEASTLLIMIKN